MWKRKPYWSPGRWLHLLWGAGIPSLGAWLFGDPGLVAGTVAVVVGGFVWERTNATWPKGNWMFSDVVDFVFFVFGLAIADFVIIVLTGGFG